MRDLSSRFGLIERGGDAVCPGAFARVFLNRIHTDDFRLDISDAVEVVDEGIQRLPIAWKSSIQGLR